MHITLSREANLDHLIESKSEGLHLSIFLPVHPDTRSETINEDTIRFKNTLHAARQHLEDSKKESAKDVIKKIDALEKLSTEKSFWENQWLGLAVFINKAGYHFVHLPYEVSEKVFIENYFIVSPLLAMKGLDYNLYILDINTKDPSLYKYKDGGVSIVDNANLPGTMSDALQLDELRKAQQFHTGEGNGRAVFHGHGGNTEAKDVEVEAYLRLLADRVDLYLKKIAAKTKNDKTPLILLGSKKRVSILKDTLEYDSILEHESGTDTNSPKKQELLLETSEHIVNDLIDSDQQRLLQELQDKYANELTVIGADAIKTACDMNNVEKLLVPLLTKTNDSVRNGVAKQYKIMLPDSMSQWEQAARNSLACGAEVRALDLDNHSVTNDIVGLCRFTLDLK